MGLGGISIWQLLIVLVIVVLWVGLAALAAAWLARVFLR